MATTGISAVSGPRKTAPSRMMINAIVAMLTIFSADCADSMPSVWIAASPVSSVDRSLPASEARAFRRSVLTASWTGLSSAMPWKETETSCARLFGESCRSLVATAVTRWIDALFRSRTSFATRARSAAVSLARSLRRTRNIAVAPDPAAKCFVATEFAFADSYLPGTKLPWSALVTSESCGASGTITAIATTQSCYYAPRVGDDVFSESFEQGALLS